MNNIKNELKGLSTKELVEKVDALRRELFSLRLHSATEPVKDKTQFKKLRKNIARGLTYLEEKMREEYLQELREHFQKMEESFKQEMLKQA